MTAATALRRRGRPARYVPSGDLDKCRLGLFSNLTLGLKNAKISFEKFLIDAWPIIEPNNPLINNWHIGYLAEHLEAVTLRQLNRLAISIHPRSAKSNIATVLWPCWAWAERAWLRWIFASYSQELSTKHSLQRRRIIESDWYQKQFGTSFQIMPDQNRKNIFENTARGVMFSTSKGGTVTGYGANVIVFDDFINPKEAESETERKEAIAAYSNTFSSRLDDKKNDAMVLLAQRTHHDDLTAHVLREGGWTHIELPVIAEQKISYSFPLSKKEHIREVGELLNPAREDLSTVEHQKKISGSRTFSAQWMCNPSSDKGNMVKRHWWKFYKEEPRQLIQKMQIVCQSWDFAFKELETSSWIVGLIMGRHRANKYVFSEIRDHMDFTQTCHAVASASANWPQANFKFYEDRANGPAVKSAMASRVPGLIAVEPLGSKEARMASATPDIEAGNVFLPYPYADDGSVRADRQWVLDFIEELARFPEEPNDRGDALSQGIIKLNNIVLYDGDASEEGGTIVDSDFGEAEALDMSDIGGFDAGFL